LNRFAILSALGGAVIAVALLVNYAINREGVGEGSAPTPTVTTAPSTAGTPAPSGGTSSGQAGTSAPSTEAPAAQSSTSESGSTSSPSNAGAGAAQEQAATSGATGGAPASEAVGQSAAPALPAAPRSASGAVSSAAGTTSSTVASTGNAGGGAATTPAIKPSFDIVRVNPDGGTVIAGRAAPHANVTLTADGQKLGTVTADDRGEWVIVPESKLAPGNHQIAIASQLGDSAPVPSDDIVVVVVPRPQVASGGQSSGGTQTALAQPQQPLAVVVPRTDQGSTVLQAPSPPQSGLLALQSVDYDADGLVVIGGQAPPGKQVRAYLDNRLIGIARADSSGRWRVKPSGMVPPGLHTLRVDEVDDSGKVLARVESPFSRAEPLNIAAGDQVVVVQPGNSLWLIATRTYGSGFRYTVIYQANKTQIKDPDLIYPGQVFKLPTASASP
jgi:nucleoid-associated protein YgaU